MPVNNLYLHCLRAARKGREGRVQVRSVKEVLLNRNLQNRSIYSYLEPRKSSIFTSWSNFLKVFFSAYVIKQNFKMNAWIKYRVTIVQSSSNTSRRN